MHRVVIFLLFIAFAGSVRAQEWPPELTEVWEPEPALVTPGVGTQAPSDAIVLFDGSSLEAWERESGGDPGWEIHPDGYMTAVRGAGGLQTRESFGDVQLHVEWRTPSEVEGEGQGRGNSGVFLQERYEVQVLDSYENRTYSNGQAGSIYKQHAPMVNASRGPGEWQVYDILFRAPVFDSAGKIARPAMLTVLHNGVAIQHGSIVQGPTGYRGLPPYVAHGVAPVTLQDHGNPVSYRNIWIRRLD